MGTNCVGKSTVLRQLIKEAGGISYVEDRVSYCSDGRTAAIGDYSKGKKIEGVDSFGETKIVSDIIKRTERDIVLFEGLKCGTFGESIQNALFQADNNLVVFLYATAECINDRLIKRSGKGIQTVQVLRQQRSNFNAALKYKEIGLPVLSFNSGETSTEDITKRITNKIKAIRNVIIKKWN